MPVGATNAVNSSAPAKTKPAAAPAKKDSKKSLKGVLVKKKSKPISADAAQASDAVSKGKAHPKQPDDKLEKDERQAKRRKLSAG